MPISLECKNCGQKYRLPNSMAGTSKKCRKCNSNVPVPGRSLELRSPRRPRPFFWMFVGAFLASSLIFSVQEYRRRVINKSHTGLEELELVDPESMTPAQRIYNNSIDSIVFIYCFKDGRRVGHGSGFVVYPGDQIATNEHVVRGVDYVIVENYYRQRFKIRDHLGQDRYNDVALLPSPANFNCRGLKISPRHYEVGAPMFTIGSPEGVRFGISEGVLVDMRHDLKNGLGPMIQVDISVAPGASGSPILDSDGKVSGVISRSRRDNRKYTFGVLAEALQDLVDNDHKPNRF